jgi:hypothetical protein
MTTAVFSSAFTRDVQAPSRFSVIAVRVINALIESRTKTAERELRRHEALMADLGRRQYHSGLFHEQASLLPFKI